MLNITKNAEKPRRSGRGWIGVGCAGLNAQEPNNTHAVPEPSNGRGNCRGGSPGIHAGEDVHWLAYTDQDTPCSAGTMRDGRSAQPGVCARQGSLAVPWAPAGETSHGRRLPGRDLSWEVAGCLSERETLSVAIREDVPLDKSDVSYYSFHTYPVSTAGGAAAPERGSSGAMRRHSERCKASAMLRRLRIVGLRLPCSI